MQKPAAGITGGPNDRKAREEGGVLPAGQAAFCAMALVISA